MTFVRDLLKDAGEDYKRAIHTLLAIRAAYETLKPVLVEIHDIREKYGKDFRNISLELCCAKAGEALSRAEEILKVNGVEP